MSYQLDTPYSNQVIFLNSENAISRNIDGDGTVYEYNFQTPIQVPINCQLLLSITDVQLPNIMPNVNASNNKISFYIPAFSKYFTITVIDDDGSVDKNYNVNSFLNVVNYKILLEAISQFTLQGVYDENNAKIVWYSNFYFQIINTPNYPTTCLDLIGGNKDNKNNFSNSEILFDGIVSPAYHINMPSCVNFTNTRFIFLKFKNISVPNMNSNGIQDNSLIRISNNAPFGHIIFYRPNEVQRFLITKKNINNISFSLTDMNGNDLNIWSNDSQITLKLETIYKPQMRSVEEGTIQYELRKLNKNFPKEKELEGVYNPETNEFIRD